MKIKVSFVYEVSDNDLTINEVAEFLQDEICALCENGDDIKDFKFDEV